MIPKKIITSAYLNILNYIDQSLDNTVICTRKGY